MALEITIAREGRETAMHLFRLRLSRLALESRLADAIARLASALASGGAAR